MNPEKKAALEAAGFRVTTVKEFLGLSDAEMEEVERRVAAAMIARRQARLSKKGAKIVAALAEMAEGLKVRNAKEGAADQKTKIPCCYSCPKPAITYVRWKGTRHYGFICQDHRNEHAGYIATDYGLSHPKAKSTLAMIAAMSKDKPKDDTP